MKETKQQRRYNELLNLYGKKPSLPGSASKKAQVTNQPTTPEFFMKSGAITKNLLQSVILASILMIIQYALGRVL